MARSRKKAVEAPSVETNSTETPPETTTQAPDIFDEQIALREKAAEIVQDTADSMAPPEASQSTNGFAGQHAPKTHAPGFIANPSSKRRESHAESVTRRLPDQKTVIAGDLKVQMIDAGRNEMGIGIRVVTPDDRKLTEEEKGIIRLHVKGEEGEQTGFTWDRDNGMWLKHILREDEHVDDVPTSRPVAIRLAAERRVQQLAEALREHSADPAGYADMVQQRREQAAESSRIPD
jgi:hypothetical protein